MAVGWSSGTSNPQLASINQSLAIAVEYTALWFHSTLHPGRQPAAQQKSLEYTVQHEAQLQKKPGSAYLALNMPVNCNALSTKAPLVNKMQVREAKRSKRCSSK